MSARRLALRILITSVLIAAALGIFALLTGEMSELGVKVLLTTITISGTSLLALASFAAWNQRGARVFSRVGLSSAMATAAILIAAIWSDTTLVSGEVLLTCIILGIAGAHGSLLSLARLAPNHRWARAVGHLVGTLLVTAILALVWDLVEGTDGLWRLVGALAILDAAATVMIIAFHVMETPSSPTDR
jgi:hypothetical protein